MTNKKQVALRAIKARQNAAKVVIKPMQYTDKAWTVNAGGVVYPNKMEEEQLPKPKGVPKPRLPGLTRLPRLPKV